MDQRLIFSSSVKGFSGLYVLVILIKEYIFFKIF